MNLSTTTARPSPLSTASCTWFLLGTLAGKLLLKCFQFLFFRTFLRTLGAPASLGAACALAFLLRNLGH